ncbi:hypothetical protein [Arcticibacterium luteifluviistationis]|uniref:hypothetical protein n=1 Tax=Arcticibacterium luteifluviistationis TaxID=1784714 RepID=UPI0013A6FEE7|nr:hypothetical protein [Arcticibacterium luteifluviistationis]
MVSIFIIQSLGGLNIRLGPEYLEVLYMFCACVASVKSPYNTTIKTLGVIFPQPGH